MLSDDERAAYQRDWMRPPTDRTTTTVPLGNRRSHPMYAIHAGAKPAHLDALAAAARSVGLDPILDGDGWNCWGEQPGTDVNDADTLHVLVYLPTLGAAIDLALTLAQAYPEYLVPSTGGRVLAEDYSKQSDNLVVVSRADDWAEQYLVVTTRGASTLANTVA